MTQRSRPRRSQVARALATLAFAGALVGAAAPVAAQWVRQNEQFYLPADHNWVFRRNYSAADRLFNAFDYGHAILYEELYTRPDAPVERLEEKEFRFLTERLLKRPPRVPLEEGAIEIEYVKLAPEAKLMFEWAHVLHRQLYDILADERLSESDKDAAVARVMAYYRSRPDLAFSATPKGMDIMDGHYYSLAFRERYPKFNGLIWAYHWLQVGLYEPLLLNQGSAARARGVNATVARFWQMLENAPESMPYLMPMTAGVAPAFSARYPEAAIVFDNLHMMHDVISDILASPQVPRSRKREEILRAAAMFRDDTSYVIPVAEWQAMGESMGLHNMGGPAVGFTDPLPTPTVSRGMSMAGMSHAPGGGHEHMGHGAPAPAPAGAGGHEGHAEQAGHAGHAAPMDHSAHAGHAQPTDSAAVAAVVERFHAALAAGDGAAALALLADDAQVMDGGEVLDRAAYGATGLAADLRAARSAGAQRGPVRARVAGDAAWASSTDAHLAELLVLVREGAGWRIAAIHRAPMH